MSQSRPQASFRLRFLLGVLGAVKLAHRSLVPLQLTLHRKINFQYRFKRRPDDVFICTYPKSGTTILQMMIHQLRGDGDMDGIPHIHAVVPWLEPEVLAENFRFLESLPSPRVFKTHLYHELMPPGAKYIYIVRDPRDVYVSGYHHHCLMMGQRVPPENYTRMFQKGHALHGTWFDHLASWWPHRGEPNVLFLTFEGMLADMAGTVRRVAEFVGLPLDESRMPRILERCGLAFMKRYDEKFDPRLQRTEETHETFIRKGKTGGWGEELPPNLQQMLEANARAFARRLGGDGEDPFAFLLGGGAAAARPQPVAAGPRRLAGAKRPHAEA